MIKSYKNYGPLGNSQETLACCTQSYNLHNKYLRAKTLGIDKIALKKGKHDYCLVSLDMEKSKLYKNITEKNKRTVRRRINYIG